MGQYVISSSVWNHLPGLWAYPLQIALIGCHLSARCLSVLAGTAARDGCGVPPALCQPISIQGVDARPGQDLPQRDDEGWPPGLLLMTHDNMARLYA